MAEVSKLDDEIDKLFQLPLAEFTPARNALAKTAGRDGAAIKALTKPPLAAWAVNQLHWNDRDTYEALVDAANDMRRAHKAVIEGRSGDLRATGKAHETALDAALKSTIAIMKEQGQPVTEATKQAIVNTLRALPSDEPAGRLTRTLTPGGFEMLAGITVGRRKASGPSRPSGPSAPSGPSGAKAAKGTKRTAAQKAADAKAEREAAKAREKREALERAVRDADQRARQAEFEAARTARDAAKHEKAADEARRVFEEAREALDAAEKASTAAVRARELADRRVREARAALDAAREKLD